MAMVMVIMIDRCSSFQIVLPSIPSISGEKTRDVYHHPIASRRSHMLHSTKPRPKKSGRSPSRVTDPSGPTPDVPDDEPEVISLKDLPELEYDESNHPVPHQPWRRGITDGCDDPIDAPWRQEAEEIMTKAVTVVGGTLLDVTWYLTAVVVTIDDEWERVNRNPLKTRGPVINVYEARDPQYRDPDDPNPEDVWAEEYETDIVFSKDKQAAEDLKRQMYARKEDDEEEMQLDPDDDVSLYMDEETKIDDALRYKEDLVNRAKESDRPIDPEYMKIDTTAISTIAGAILDALEPHESRLRVLERHEVILTSPAQGVPDVIESQRQFDDARGSEVKVETQDPWNSNRVLRGKLIDRNSMDVMINQKGRMVTIPLNFVRCVRLRYRPKVDDNKVVSDEDDYEDEGEIAP